MYLLISILLLSSTVLGETAVRLGENKKDFLKAPIFKDKRDSVDNSQRWKIREENGGSKFENNELLPLSTNKSTLNLAHPSCISADEAKASIKTVQKIAPNTLPQYSQIPKPSIAEDASECGFNSYTLNYCLYLSHKPKPLICSEKWNRCLEGYQP